MKTGLVVGAVAVAVVGVMLYLKMKNSTPKPKKAANPDYKPLANPGGVAGILNAVVKTASLSAPSGVAAEFAQMQNANGMSWKS